MGASTYYILSAVCSSLLVVIAIIRLDRDRK